MQPDERERDSGLGRSLREVLAGRTEPDHDRAGPLFDAGRGEEDRLGEVLDVLAIAFEDDLCGSCTRSPDAPASTRVRGEVGDVPRAWALADALGSAVGCDGHVLLQRPDHDDVTFAVPVGSTGALGVMRVGGPLSPRDRHLVYALGRLAAR